MSVVGRSPTAWGKLVGSLQGAAAGSRIGVRAAVKIKRQCDSIIGLRASAGIDHDTNGESALARIVAPEAEYFVDVGANVGAWSLMFSEMMKEPLGLLFEPSPSTAVKLSEVIAEAGLSGLSIVSSALSDIAGLAPFFEESIFGETASLIESHSARSSRSVLVPITTLDVELDRRSINKVDYLKIDAEGYDLRVLLGSRGSLASHKIRTVQFEYNYPWAAAGSTLLGAFRHLEELGYAVRNIQPSGLFEVDPVSMGEYFRYSNFLAYTPEAGEMFNHLQRGRLF